jgi:hypothetical protein
MKILSLVPITIELDDPRYCNGCNELWDNPAGESSCEATLSRVIWDGENFVRPKRCSALEHAARRMLEESW